MAKRAMKLSEWPPMERKQVFRVAIDCTQVAYSQVKKIYFDVEAIDGAEAIAIVEIYMADSSNFEYNRDKWKISVMAGERKLREIS